jgi:folate-binding protein YgfZ
MDAYERLRHDRLERGLRRFQLRVEGRDRVRFLHNVCTNDIRGLKPGQGCAASMVDRAGKLVAVFHVQMHADHLFLDAPCPIQDALQRYIIMDDVKLVPVETPVSGVFGPRAVEEVKLPLYHFETRDRVVVQRVPYGYHVFGREAPPEEDAWQVFRIETGIPEWGKEIHESVIPVEVGLGDTISYTKGCYVGQEVLLRLRNFGEPKQLLRGILLDGPPERITSACRSRALNRDIALAVLRKDQAAAGTRLPFGTVADLPFVDPKF